MPMLNFFLQFFLLNFIYKKSYYPQNSERYWGFSNYKEMNLILVTKMGQV